MPVYMTNHKGDMIESTVKELLPYGFSGKDLNKWQNINQDLFQL